MVKNIKNTYESLRIVLDGNSFEDCTFNSCILEFGATSPVSLVGNKIIDCQWKFVGAAADTIAFLRAISRDAGSDGEKFLLSLFRGPIFAFSGAKDEGVFPKIDEVANVHEKV